MDQQTITVIVIIGLTIIGFAMYFATIYFGPNMKDYFDKK